MYSYSIPIIIALIITLILFKTRVPIKITEKGTIFINSTFVCVIILFSLLLGFVISNFFTHLSDIRNNITYEILNLRIIYRMLYDSPNSEAVRISIENYLKLFVEIGIPSLEIKQYPAELEIKYNIMNYTIIKYLSDNPTNPFNNDIVSRLSSSEIMKVYIYETNQKKFYIYILILVFILILCVIYFVRLDSKIIQFLIESFFISILVLSLYLLNALNDPFNPKNPISVNLDGYKILLKEIEITNKQIIVRG